MPIGKRDAALWLDYAYEHVVKLVKPDGPLEFHSLVVPPSMPAETTVNNLG